MRKMSEKRVKKGVVVQPTELPRVDQEVAQRHIAAYYFALYGNCDCEACQLLRPIAEKMTSVLKKKKEG
jgi:hypothetical protein